jgi:dTMP kinase
MTPGKLVVIDGTDGSGKQTQTKRLIERLQTEGYPVQTMSFPQYGQKSAALVEEYLAGKFGTAQEVGPKAASIFYACDRFAASQQIREWLAAGQHVVLDRYVSANMGHQGGQLTDPAERQAFFRWNDELEHEIFGIPRPDLTLILHCPYEIAHELTKQRDGDDQDILQADADHLKQAEATYLKMAELFEEMKLVSCCPSGQMLPIEEIHSAVWALVEPLLQAADAQA